MDIVYITTQEQGQSDAILSQVATQLAEQGLRLAGVVQTNSDRPDCHGCDMDVSVLPDGPTIRISQSNSTHRPWNMLLLKCKRG